MDIKVTNFDGDLDSPCSYCQKPHRSHLTEVGVIAGEMYWHREPCEAQIDALELARAPANGLLPKLFRNLFSKRAS